MDTNIYSIRASKQVIMQVHQQNSLWTNIFQHRIEQNSVEYPQSIEPNRQYQRKIALGSSKSTDLKSKQPSSNLDASYYNSKTWGMVKFEFKSRAKLPASSKATNDGISTDLTLQQVTTWYILIQTNTGGPTRTKLERHIHRKNNKAHRN